MNIWFQQNISPLKKKKEDYWTSHMHNFAENRTTYFIDAVVHRYIFCLILFFGLYFRKKEILKETVAHLGGVDLRLANRINWMERRNKINHRKKKKKSFQLFKNLFEMCSHFMTFSLGLMINSMTFASVSSLFWHV